MVLKPSKNIMKIERMSLNVLLCILPNKYNLWEYLGKYTKLETKRLNIRFAILKMLRIIGRNFTISSSLTFTALKTFKPSS